MDKGRPGVAGGFLCLGGSLAKRAVSILISSPWSEKKQPRVRHELEITGVCFDRRSKDPKKRPKFSCAFRLKVEKDIDPLIFNFIREKPLLPLGVGGKKLVLF